MPRIASIDTYIQRTLGLFEAAPSDAKVSITYGSNLKKHKGDSKSLKSKKPVTKNFVVFKTYEPAAGICLRYKTYKVKEFSRLLSLLGPKSIQFKNGSVRSVGSLMANSLDQSPAAESGLDTKENTPQPVAAAAPQTTTSSSKKKKKKGKR